MIKLSYNPVVGTSIPIQLSFRDDFGTFYVPIDITYTVLALNSNRADWQIVSGLEKVSITPASMVNILLDSTATVSVPETTLERKVIVSWRAMLNNQLAEFIEEIDFTLNQYPVITNSSSPVPPTPSTPEDPVCSVLQAVIDGEIKNSLIIKFPIPIQSDRGVLTVGGTNYEGVLNSSATELTVDVSELVAGTYTVKGTGFIGLDGAEYNEFELEFKIETKVFNTSEIVLSNPEIESLDGTAVTLQEAITQIVNKLKTL